MSGICSGVTQPDSNRAETSELPATSSRPAKPWTKVPTLQLAWSLATVEKVRSMALVQKTHPAGTGPVLPSGAGGGFGPSKGSTSSGSPASKVIAIGGVVSSSDAVSASARSGQEGEFIAAGSSGAALSTRPRSRNQTRGHVAQRSQPVNLRSATSAVWEAGGLESRRAGAGNGRRGCARPLST